MATEKGITNKLQHEVGDWFETWTGTADGLIAAGVLERALLPGEPGNNKASATYYKGVLVKRGSNHPYDQDYLSIVRRGNKFEVKKGKARESYDVSTRMREEIGSMYETRHGTKEQLQACGIGWGKLYPGELGANKQRLTTIDARGYEVEITRNQNHWEPPYSTCTFLPQSVRSKRAHTVNLNAVENYLIHIFRQLPKKFIDKAIIDAMGLEIDFGKQWEATPPAFNVGQTVAVSSFSTKGLGEVTKIEWHIGDNRRTGWIYFVDMKGSTPPTQSYYENCLSDPPLASVSFLPGAASGPVKQRGRGRLPTHVPQIGRA
ncbi:MAG: hypothetical protein JWM78_3422 [Verrucomicrobiaceae bacterium]|nr:hypothetical protein [Verrucomicrobiaceae bacterium]